MKFYSRGLLLLAVIPFVLGQAVLADDATPTAPDKLKALLAQDRRPTMLEVMNLFPDGMPDLETVNAWLSTSVQMNPAATANLISNLGLLVAQVETAFPDARYATLGRDAVFAADMLEAYYLALGQTDRVRRIHISTASSAAPDAELGSMLLTVGLDADPNGRRFVLLDRTSYAAGRSQSYKVMTAAVNILRKSGLSNEAALAKLGVGSSQQGTQVMSFAASRKSAGGVPIGAPSLPELVHIGALKTYVDQAAWHNTYNLPLVRYDNGEVGGTISQYDTFTSGRPQILATQILVLREVFSNRDAIVKVAQEQANSLGYSYTPNSGKPGVARPPILVSAQARASQILNERIRKSIEETLKHPEQFQPEIAAMVNFRVATIAAEFAGAAFSGAEEEKLADGKILKSYDDWWAKMSAPYRALLSRPNRTDITNFGVQLAIGLPAITQEEHDKLKSYFSANGKDLYEVFKRVRAAGEVDSSAVLEILALSAIAESERKVTPRDLRRLMLYSLAVVEGDAPSFYENLPKLLADFPKLKGVFEERSEVFLTSERYDGAAKPVFEKLMKTGIIDAERAAKNCTKLLEGKDGDAAA